MIKLSVALEPGLETATYNVRLCCDVNVPAVVNALLIVVVPLLDPIDSVVAAPAKLTVVAVSLTRLNDVALVVKLVVADSVVNAPVLGEVNPTGIPKERDDVLTIPTRLSAVICPVFPPRAVTPVLVINRLSPYSIFCAVIATVIPVPPLNLKECIPVLAVDDPVESSVKLL